jgi:hypothetical protein
VDGQHLPDVAADVTNVSSNNSSSRLSNLQQQQQHWEQWIVAWWRSRPCVHMTAVIASADLGEFAFAQPLVVSSYQKPCLSEQFGVRCVLTCYCARHVFIF